MTALERARHFIKTTAAHTALVIVPLAAAAPASAASIDFNAATATATAGKQSGATVDITGGGQFEVLPDGGVKFYGDYVYDLIAGNSGSGYQTKLTLTLNGTGTGVLDMASIPAHFDYIFDLGTGHPFQNFFSSIEFFFGTASMASSGPLSTTGDGMLYQEESASDFALAGWAPQDEEDLADWSVVLTASFFMPSETTGVVKLSIPNHSIDIMPGGVIDPVDPAAVPEPASLLLLGSGAAVLIRRRAVRRGPVVK